MPPHTSAFVISFLVGLIVGLFLGYFFAKKIHLDENFVWANLFGGCFGVLWAGLHTYAIFSGQIEVPFIFDVVGGLAMGQTLGIDLASQINKFRK